MGVKGLCHCGMGVGVGIDVRPFVVIQGQAAMGPRWRGDETRGNQTLSTGTTNDLFTGAVYLRAAL